MPSVGVPGLPGSRSLAAHSLPHPPSAHAPVPSKDGTPTQCFLLVYRVYPARGALLAHSLPHPPSAHAPVPSKDGTPTECFLLVYRVYPARGALLAHSLPHPPSAHAPVPSKGGTPTECLLLVYRVYPARGALLRIAPPRYRATSDMTAFWACRRFSASWKIVSACASSTPSVISLPRYAGRQCITMAWAPAAFTRASLI